MLRSLERWEKIIYITVLALALFSRFYDLGDRAMSHDESIHTKFAWNLYEGLGFQHNPMMHGPLLFEATAMMYEVFGANDFTSRLFVAIVGVVLVLTPILFRRWLGKFGAAFAALCLLISPSITYYSRYIRHDILLLLSAVILLWTVLSYIDDGKTKYLYYAAAAFSIMYTTKEASYMYTLIFLVLCTVPLLIHAFTARWQNPQLIKYVLLIAAVIVICGALFGLAFMSGQVTETALDESGNTRAASVQIPLWGRIAGGSAFALIFVVLVLLVYAVGKNEIRANRWFDVVLSLGTLTLPLGSAFVIKYIAGVDMDLVYNAILNGNFTSVPPATIAIFAIVVLLMLGSSAALGLWWNKRVWWRMALIHYSLFFVLYTTIFTWVFGALTGLVGSLAYWLGQQDVKRGNQPVYYYILLGGLYEYLPIVVSFIAGVLVILGNHREMRDKLKRQTATLLSVKDYLPWLLIGWTLLSWLIYTWAGEKMPWLIVHIALPSIFLSAVAVQYVCKHISMMDIRAMSLWLAILGIPLLAAGLVTGTQAVVQLSALRDSGNPEAGYTLDQLNAIGGIIGGSILVISAIAMLTWTIRKHGFRSLFRITAIAALIVMVVLTIRTSVMANFVNDELATEFLVYAHATPDIKVALDQIEDVSWITNGSPTDVKIAYGEDGSWPFVWYMVNFPNNYFYSTSPDPDTLISCPVIIAGSKQYDVVDEIVGNEYRIYEYQFLWWPIQDYFGLTLQRVSQALSDPAMRAALWDIVWARDYHAYAGLKNELSPFDLKRWPLRSEFRLYVRNDLAQQAWGYEYGAQSIRSVKPEATMMPDPYTAGARFLPAESIFTLPGAALRGFALAQDGTLYVTDTNNHKVWHLDSNGNNIGFIGGQGSQPGQFQEPWDVTLDDTGNIYVADTWNHRIQKFNPGGEFIAQWGMYGMSTDTSSEQTIPFFFGPRGIAYLAGELYVTDTGNKRIQVLSTDGTLLRAFGGAGNGAGQFDEPVGIALSESGLVAIADTWHKRIQLVDINGRSEKIWDIPVWDTANPDVKPYVSMNETRIAVTDPVHRRVLLFDYDGAFQWALSAEAGTSLTFAQAVLLTEDAIYVTDTYASTLTKYKLP